MIPTVIVAKTVLLRIPTMTPMSVHAQRRRMINIAQDEATLCRPERIINDEDVLVYEEKKKRRQLSTYKFSSRIEQSMNEIIILIICTFQSSTFGYIELIS
jgi:hypothetical protein